MNETIKSYKAKVDEASHGMRLDQYLVLKFGDETGLSRRAMRTRIETGYVKIRGHVLRRLSYAVKTGDSLELKAPEAIAPDLWLPTEDHILFEDDDLIAINKPAGLPTQSTLDKNRHHLFKAIEVYVKSHDADGYVGLHHRLDKDTSGIVVFTKSKRANVGISDQLQKHEMRKTYLAISAIFPESPKIASEWKVKNHLRKSVQFKGKMEVGNSGGDYAETDFEKIEELNEAVLIKAQPRTGRMHQIRVHLSGAALPILGDQIYGTRATARRAPRMMLHAWQLILRHPMTNEEMTLEAPPPEDFETALIELGSKISSPSEDEN